MKKNNENTTTECDDIPQELLKAINERSERRRKLTKNLNHYQNNYTNNRFRFTYIMVFAFGVVGAACGFLAGLLF